jgi:hypothetical protein
VRRPLLLLLALSASAASACSGDGEAGEPAAVEATPYPTVDLVSPRLDDVAIGEPGWAHGQTATADLDGDGVPERAIIIANAEDYHGRVLWNDSQIWEVYVEEPDGTRTYVYKRLLQLGSLTARLARPEHAGPIRPGERPEPPTILLLEHTPQSFSAYEVRYAGPAQATAVKLTSREFDLRSLFEGTPDP